MTARQSLRALPSLALLVGLVACEELDPAGWVTGPVAPPERISLEGFDPGAPFPSLARIPTTPPRPTPKRDRLDLAGDLAAQRTEARYTEGPARRRAPERRTAPSGASVPSVPSAAGSAAARSRTPTPPGPAPLPPLALAAPASDGAEPGVLLRATPPGGRAAGAAPEPAARLVAVFYFAGRASDLDPADRDLVKEVALLHRQRGGLLRVVGHAAPQPAGPGSPGLARVRLSLARASKVAGDLAALGSAPDSLVVSAADAGASESDDPRHHRVEIFLEE